MKLLKRNVRECGGQFQYYKYLGLGSDIDENGFHTGDPPPVYADPVWYEGNISTPSGSATQAFDGIEVQYTHVLVMDNPNVDIDEYGYIVWKGREYSIEAVRPSINVMSIALRQRPINHGDQTIAEEEEEEEETEPEGDN